MDDVGNNLQTFDVLTPIASMPHKDRFCGLRLIHGHITLPHLQHHHLPHHQRHQLHKPHGHDPLFILLGVKLTDSFTGAGLLSNLQNPAWIADGLSFVCLFISSLKSTLNNAQPERN